MKILFLTVWLLSATFCFGVELNGIPVVVTNRTPEITVGESWDYAHPPGYYFWTGASFGFGCVVVGMVFAMMRSAFGTSSEI